jgi:transcriptional regulator with XRE-family HTH domain
MFWDNFVLLCERAGKSPNAVAAEIGFKSTGTVTGWKDGKIPYERNLKKIAEYFGVTVDYLLNGQKENAPGSDAESEIEKVLAQATPLQIETIKEVLAMSTNQLNALRKMLDAAKVLAE